MYEQKMSPAPATGMVSNLQHCSVHDGPGIRTTVFLKGCNMRCQWCHNPETISFEREMLFYPEKCIGCGMCDEGCFAGAKVPCGDRMTVDDVFQDIQLDQPYYGKDGGVTVSGGEPLCQPEFARDLLRAAKERGINTAIESMACVPWKNIEMVLPYLDTYLMDIKHTNQEKHKQFTGKPNGLALENARKVALSGQTNLVIRVPVVPTFNDSVEEIKSIASFASTLPGVKKIHLLPYHRLGQDKYDWLGREYKLPEILPPEPEHMELLKKAVHSVCDLDCQIGG